MERISREYAEALFELSCENGQEKEMLASLEALQKILEDMPEYRELLSSPAIPMAERAEIVDQAFRGRFPEHLVSFLQLLCERGRMDIFFECAEEYKRLFEAKDSITEATVISAVELTPSELGALKSKLEKISGKKVLLKCETDAELMGGIKVEMDGTVIDGSLRHRLHELKEVINR